MFGDPWSESQRLLADQVYPQWRNSPIAGWPTYDYVEHALSKQGLDAKQVSGSFPGLGRPAISSPFYGEVAYDRLHGPAADSPVRLTIAGLAKVDSTSDYPLVFMRLLQVAGATRRDATFDPQGVTQVTLTDADLLREAVGLERWHLAAVAGTVRDEPYVVTGLSPRSSDAANGSWLMQVDKQAVR